VYYEVPRDTDAAAVIRFFRSRLAPLGWQVSMRTAARRSRVADFERDGSVVTVDAVIRPVARWRVELTIDHHARD